MCFTTSRCKTSHVFSICLYVCAKLTGSYMGPWEIPKGHDNAYPNTPPASTCRYSQRDAGKTQTNSR